MVVNRIVLVALVACGSPGTPPAVKNTPLPIAAAPLPADAELGVLAISPAPADDQASWLPSGSFPFLREEALSEGKGPPPSWLAVDGAGAEVRLTYGMIASVRYGCDDQSMTVTKLEGEGTLRPGLLWLRPLAQMAWRPEPVAITARGEASATRRDFQVGPVTIALTRTRPKAGLAKLSWAGRPVYEVPFERHDMDGADNARPFDLAEGGIGVPMPEAAWSFQGGRAVLIAFREQSYEGLSIHTLVVNAETGRAVEGMGMYLYQCAF